MAKALVGLAVWLLVAVPAFSAGPAKKNPTWEQLTPQQQKILAPIQREWNQFDAKRKQKWLRMAKRYPKMSSSEQERLQQRMKEWVSLTPEERSAARSRFREFEQLSPERKASVRRKWEQYQRKRAEEARAAEAARNAAANPQSDLGTDSIAPGSEALGLRPQ
ncbi:MAG: DUF3106 domain-containing protein [Betaproteobacteria bacterium]|nr:DUF3106 domain-containing protein [Betaproteobacteria bacterium]